MSDLETVQQENFNLLRTDFSSGPDPGGSDSHPPDLMEDLANRGESTEEDPLPNSTPQKNHLMLAN